MNDFLREFVMETIREMTESVNVTEWEVRKFALGWYKEGVLTEADLQEIKERYKRPEPVEENTVVEPTVEEPAEEVIE